MAPFQPIRQGMEYLTRVCITFKSPALTYMVDSFEMSDSSTISKYVNSNMREFSSSSLILRLDMVDWPCL